MVSEKVSRRRSFRLVLRLTLVLQALLQIADYRLIICLFSIVANLLETTSKALISNQTTTTEFLRQYWSFVAPQPDPSYNPDEGRTLSGNRAIPPIALSMEQRKVKAASMKERLRRTEERVKDLIKRAEEAGEPDAQVKILSVSLFFRRRDASAYLYRDRCRENACLHSDALANHLSVQKYSHPLVS